MSDREQDLTNSLVKVTTGRQMKAYFVEGHGESDTSASIARIFSVVDVLKRDNYTVDKIVLAQTRRRPADASVLIIAGPTADYLAPEIDAIRKYLRSGGKALFMLDPPIGEACCAATLEGCSRSGGSRWDTTSCSTSAAWADARHRRLGAGGHDVSVASRDRELRPDDRLSARAIGQGRGRREPSAAIAEPHQDGRPKLVGVGRQVAWGRRQGVARRSDRRS